MRQMFSMPYMLYRKSEKGYFQRYQQLRKDFLHYIKNLFLNLLIICRNVINCCLMDMIP